jgi:hypothetical protein
VTAAERAPAGQFGSNFSDLFSRVEIFVVLFFFFLKDNLLRGMWFRWTAFEQVRCLMWGRLTTTPPLKNTHSQPQVILNELKWIKSLGFMWLPLSQMLFFLTH